MDEDSAASCSIEQCDRPIRARGWCHPHWRRWKRHGDPQGGQQVMRSPKPRVCMVEDCERTPKSRGLCNGHHRRLALYGDVQASKPIRTFKSNEARYVGYRYMSTHGYWLVYMPDHPNAATNGYVREHALVMADHLGRPLIKGENVHHKNGDRGDNSFANLELWTTHQPKGQRVSDRIEDAKRILALYGGDPDKYRSV